MHDKLHKTAEKLLDFACAKMETEGLCNLNAKELGEITDMLKDLNEAEYYARISHAMKEESDGEKMGYRHRGYTRTDGDRMGYDRWRYADGEFAPKGRGHMGYTPMHMEPETGGRMGYPSPMEMGTYREYDQRRRNYTANKTADNKREMETSAEHHLRETMDNMREVLGEVDQPMRQKIKSDLMALVNEL